jgi:hypothetical protein
MAAVNEDITITAETAAVEKGIITKEAAAAAGGTNIIH